MFFLSIFFSKRDASEWFQSCLNAWNFTPSTSVPILTDEHRGKLSAKEKIRNYFPSSVPTITLTCKEETTVSNNILIICYAWLEHQSSWWNRTMPENITLKSSFRYYLVLDPENKVPRFFKTDQWQFIARRKVSGRGNAWDPPAFGPKLPWNKKMLGFDQDSLFAIGSKAGFFVLRFYILMV